MSVLLVVAWGLPVLLVSLMASMAAIQYVPLSLRSALLAMGMVLGLATGLAHAALGEAIARGGWPVLVATCLSLSLATPVATTWFARHGMGSQTDVVRSGQRDVFLTFDDGPSAEWTPAILDALKRHGATATFLMLGNHIECHGDVVHRVVAEGHTVGVHSHTHPPLVWLSRAQVRHELEACVSAMSLHAAVRWLRPPWGLHSRLVRDEARRLGLRMLLWTDSVRDWTNPGADAVCRTVLQQARPGAILLLHDASHDGHRTCSDTVAGLDQALPLLRQRGLVCRAWPSEGL